MAASTLARLLIGAGIVLVLVGTAVALGARLGLGRLPGDLSFGSGDLRVYVPLATMIVVSLVLTVVLNILLRR